MKKRKYDESLGFVLEKELKDNFMKIIEDKKLSKAAILRDMIVKFNNENGISNAEK